MRLIDADALLKSLKEQRFKYDTSEDCITVEQATETCCELIPYLIVGMIEEMPTVDAEPVRHGKWIHEVRYTIDSLHSYQQYRCSECGMTYITNTKYCPNCGARMDEE